MNMQELRDLSLEALGEKINEMRHELFVLRMNAATEHMASFSSKQRLLKKNIARALTIAREKSTI